jgi:hypothetical protein
MYDQHAPVIAAYARTKPEGLYRAALFAVLSIRRPTTGLPDAMTDVLAGNGGPHLFGWKAQSYAFLTENKDALWRAMLACESNESAIFTMASVPGLGIIKAAFVCQMFGFDVACLDSRNMAVQGRHTREYLTRGEARKRMPKFRHDVARYMAETRGRARELWDDWCNAAGKTYGMTGEAISQLHLDTIVPVSERLNLDACQPCPIVGMPDEIPF